LWAALTSTDALKKYWGNIRSERAVGSTVEEISDSGQLLWQGELRLTVQADGDLQCVRRPVKTPAEQVAQETATDNGPVPVCLEMECISFGAFLRG
jgi:hypothetical protein